MLEFFQDGGPFMWPLGLWSIMALGFFIERIVTEDLESGRVEFLGRHPECRNIGA